MFGNKYLKTIFQKLCPNYFLKMLRCILNSFVSRFAHELRHCCPTSKSIAMIIDTRPGFNTSSINTRWLSWNPLRWFLRNVVASRCPHVPEPSRNNSVSHTIMYQTTLPQSDNERCLCPVKLTRENKSRPRLSRSEEEVYAFGTPCCAYTSTPLRYRWRDLKCAGKVRKFGILFQWIK